MVGFHLENFIGGKLDAETFFGKEAASLHLVILSCPIEVTHSSWLFWGGGGGRAREFGGSFLPASTPPMDKTLHGNLRHGYANFKGIYMYIGSILGPIVVCNYTAVQIIMISCQKIHPQENLMSIVYKSINVGCIMISLLGLIDLGLYT